MKDSVVARRYAKSLVKAAADEGELRALFDEFRAAVVMLTREELLDFWRNPGISVGKKVKLVGELSAQFETSRKFSSFLRVLAQKNRIKHLSRVFEEFTRLARAQLGEITVLVETPFELHEEERNDLSSILKRKLGKKIILEIKINESLLAGARIQIGDKVIDGSLNMKLQKIKESISA